MKGTARTLSASASSGTSSDTESRSVVKTITRELSPRRSKCASSSKRFGAHVCKRLRAEELLPQPGAHLGVRLGEGRLVALAREVAERGAEAVRRSQLDAVREHHRDRERRLRQEEVVLLHRRRRRGGEVLLHAQQRVLFDARRVRLVDGHAERAQLLDHVRHDTQRRVAAARVLLRRRHHLRPDLTLLQTADNVARVLVAHLDARDAQIMHDCLHRGGVGAGRRRERQHAQLRAGAKQHPRRLDVRVVAFGFMRLVHHQTDQLGRRAIAARKVVQQRLRHAQQVGARVAACARCESAGEAERAALRHGAQHAETACSTRTHARVRTRAREHPSLLSFPPSSSPKLALALLRATHAQSSEIRVCIPQGSRAIHRTELRQSAAFFCTSSEAKAHRKASAKCACKSVHVRARAS
eukprot:3909469-Pleurochrysis_carterae.AAC.2